MSEGPSGAGDGPGAPPRRARRRGARVLLLSLGVTAALHAVGLWLVDRYLWDRLSPDEAEDDREVIVEWVELPDPSPAITAPTLPAPPETPPPLDDPSAASPTVARAEPAPAAPAPKAAPEPEPEVPPAALPPPVPVLPPPAPPPPAPVPVPVPEVAPAPKPPAAELAHRKAVEVDDDEHVVDEPPVDAEYWSDKNRRVAEQTRATDTNLERSQKGDTAASAESDDRTSEEIGGPDEHIRQLEDSAASSLDARRDRESVHDGDSDRAVGVRTGQDGQGGADGDAGQDGGDGDGEPGALSMRDIEGRGAPGGPTSADPEPLGQGDDGSEVASSTAPRPAPGAPGRRGRAGTPGRPGVDLRLDNRTYERIVGEDEARREVEVARRESSHRKGRWEKRQAALRASLENFTPEIRPGNQTALGTRAHPFALYLARMHRQIHELWGFGFLEDLDGKSFGDPMNDRSLKVKMEIVLLGDGAVDKVTIVRPSGVLTFDVAAIDTVMSAAPYGEPPAAIRSPDGKVYLHWTFHRNEYQCSNLFAEPFILDRAPAGGDALQRGAPDPSQEIARRRRESSPERLRRTPGSPTDGEVALPRVRRPGEPAPVDGGRAAETVARPGDPAAELVALGALDAFEKGDLAGLLSRSGVPFRSGGLVAAPDPAALAAVWQAILAETPRRRVREWKLLSAAGYRAAFGHLPPGAEDGTPRLFVAVRLQDGLVTLHLARGEGGAYQVVGLDR